jgi:hypothetical protein
MTARTYYVDKVRLLEADKERLVEQNDKLMTALGELLIALDQNAGALYGNDEAWEYARALFLARSEVQA